MTRTPLELWVSRLGPLFARSNILKFKNSPPISLHKEREIKLVCPVVAPLASKIRSVNVPPFHSTKSTRRVYTTQITNRQNNALCMKISVRR
jgi:hypothetical protein